MLCALVLVAIAATADAGARSVPRAAPTSTGLERIAARLVQVGAPGAIVAVRTPSGVREAAAGVARIQPRAVLRPTDRYRIASVTKPFVAALVLELAAEHKLRLNDSVAQWLPRLLPNGHRITLRELLGHSSGLFDYDDDDAWVRNRIADPGRTWKPRELIAIASRHTPLFAPGTDWSYSNTNYVLLGLVVEAVTGDTLVHELRDRIFRPLGLRATSYPAVTRMPAPAVHGYLGSAPGLPVPAGRLLDVTSLLSPSAWGAGQIVSNADDLTRFFAALLGGRILPPPQLHDMTKSVEGSGPAPFTVPYGLGLDIVQTRCGTAYGHSGDMPGYRNLVWAAADGDRVAAVMVNVVNRGPSWGAIRRAAMDALCAG